MSFLQVLGIICAFVSTIQAAILTNENGLTLTLLDSGNATSAVLALNDVVKIRATIQPALANISQCDASFRCTIQGDGYNLTIDDLDYGFNITYVGEPGINLTTNINLEDINWYGGPEKKKALWPVEKKVIVDSPYITSQVDSSAVVERYWLNSRGGYVFVSDNTPLFVDQNNLVAGNLSLTASAQAPYSGRDRVVLSYVLIAVEDPKVAHLHAVKNYLGKPRGTINERLIRQPIWNTWARYQTNISDEIVVSFAKEITDRGLGGQFVINMGWEDCYGSKKFDPIKFPNAASTIEQLKALNFTVILWTHGFVNTDCELAKEGLENDYFVKNEDGNNVAQWWNGEAYYIDFTNENASSWFTDQLKAVQEQYGVDGFRFDAGESDYAPQIPVLAGDVELSPNELTTAYVKTAATFGDLGDVRSAWRTQNVPLLLRMLDKESTWDEENGLHTLITSLLQFNLNGYPFVLPDVIGGNGYGGKPSAELLARWVQAAALMPVMQFSFVPWEITSDEAKLETKALKAKRPGFTDDRYNETSYYIENGLRKVYPYYFTFTTFTKGRWVGERILDVFAREFRAHPAEEYERCIQAGTLTVNYDKVPTDYKLKHNDLLANVVHRHETPVLANPIKLIHVDEDLVVLDKPCSLPVHPCGRYRHNTVVFILAKEYNLKNLRTIHRLDRLTSGLLLFGRSPKKARQMEHQIRNRLVQKEYVCRVEGEFPDEIIECKEPIEVVSYKIGVCKVSPKGKECTTIFQKLGYNGKTSIVLCKPKTGRMHQIRVHLQYLGYPVVNDPLYNHDVFGPMKGKGGDLGGKTDEELVRDLIHIHNAENWLGMDGDSELSMFHSRKADLDDSLVGPLVPKDRVLGDDDADPVSREPSPCDESCDNNSSILCESSPHPLALSSLTTSRNVDAKVTVATQTGHEAPDFSFNPDKMTVDKHCYECKVRYRDPKPQDLVMYLHAWKYRGPGWEFETELPDWARVDWVELDISE